MEVVSKPPLKINKSSNINSIAARNKALDLESKGKIDSVIEGIDSSEQKAKVQAIKKYLKTHITL